MPKVGRTRGLVDCKGTKGEQRRKKCLVERNMMAFLLGKGGGTQKKGDV